MKCELCNMEATHRFLGPDGTIKFYCDHHAPAGSERMGESPSALKTYQPLIIAAAVIIVVAYGLTAWQGFSWPLFMQMFMATFFLVFGGMKVLAWSDFADGFTGYDPLAKKFRQYALAYPVIELFLAVLFLNGEYLNIASVITIIVLSITTVGILGAIKRGETMQCVCLGSLLSLPLGWVTVGENVLMIAMSVLMIVNSINF